MRTLLRIIMGAACALESSAIAEQVASGVRVGGSRLEIIEAFPLDANPVDRANSRRVVSFSDVLTGVMPTVVGVYPSRIVDGDTTNRFEEMLRRHYGVPLPRGNDEEGEGEERRQSQGIGSGVIVSPDGYILTNYHVVSDRRGELADEIRVQLSDQREFEATVVGLDERTDIAVLKVDPSDETLPYLNMADSSNLAVGDIVFAVGNPLQVGLTVTMGIVSATGRSDLRILGSQGYEDFIQTDASINPGNSGGPLVDGEGRLVGINTAIVSGQMGGNIGIGFAIPINLGRAIMLSLIDSGTVRRGLLGVRIRDLTLDMAEAFSLESTRGALVESVEERLPAAAAGIRRGDVIVQLDGNSIGSVNDLRFTVASTTPGTAVTISIIRDGETRDFEVVLSNMDDLYRAAAVSGDDILEGVALEELNARTRNQYEIEDAVDGLLVTRVEASSPHSRTLQAGMVIVEINDAPTPDLDTARALLRDGANKLWTYERGNFAFNVIRVD